MLETGCSRRSVVVGKDAPGFTALRTSVRKLIFLLGYSFRCSCTCRLLVHNTHPPLVGAICCIRRKLVPGASTRLVARSSPNIQSKNRNGLWLTNIFYYCRIKLLVRHMQIKNPKYNTRRNKNAHRYFKGIIFYSPKWSGENVLFFRQLKYVSICILKIKYLPTQCLFIQLFILMSSVTNLCE